MSAPGAGVVRAKTGSLTGVTALSGIVFTAARPARWCFRFLPTECLMVRTDPQAAIDAFVRCLGTMWVSGVSTVVP